MYLTAIQSALKKLPYQATAFISEYLEKSLKDLKNEK